STLAVCSPPTVAGSSKSGWRNTFESSCGASPSARKPRPWSGLARIKLDDELHVDRERHGQGVRQFSHHRAARRLVDGEPGRRERQRSCQTMGNAVEGLAAFPQRDGLALAQAKARDVDLRAVDRNVTVADQLTGGRDRSGEAGPEHDVVESPLEE